MHQKRISNVAWHALVIGFMATVLALTPQTVRAIDSSRAAAEELVTLLAKTGDIDRINQTIAGGKYQEVSDALLMTAVSLTLKKGTAVQVRYAIQNHPLGQEELNRRYLSLVKRGRIELSELTSALLRCEQLPVEAYDDGLDYVGRVRWQYDVPELQLQMKIWFFTYARIRPVFQCSQIVLSKAGEVLAELLGDRDLASATEFRSWIAENLAWYFSRAPRPGFIDSETPEDRKLLELAVSHYGARSVPESVAKKAWVLFLESAAVADEAQNTGSIRCIYELMGDERIRTAFQSVPNYRSDIEATSSGKSTLVQTLFQCIASFLDAGTILPEDALDGIQMSTSNPVTHVLATCPSGGFKKLFTLRLEEKLAGIRSLEELQGFLNRYRGIAATPNGRALYRTHLERIAEAVLPSVRARLRGTVSLKSKYTPTYGSERYCASERFSGRSRCTKCVVPSLFGKGTSTSWDCGGSNVLQCLESTQDKECVWESRSITIDKMTWILKANASIRNPYPFRMEVHLDWSTNLPESGDFSLPRKLLLEPSKSSEVRVNASKTVSGYDSGAYHAGRVTLTKVVPLLENEP